MADSTRARSRAKSPKKKSSTPGLHPGRKTKFPLWLHTGSGLWAKKIAGRMHYFGRDQDAALKEYLRVREDLEAGREPPPADDARLTVKDLSNAFLTHKATAVKIGELTQRAFSDYEAACQRFCKFVGKTTVVDRLTPKELLSYRHELAKTLGPTALGNHVGRVRSLLKFGFENGLLDRPVRLGDFRKPPKAAIRRRRAEVGSRLFTREQLRAVLDAADVHVRAMILLAINGAFGNSDLGHLPISAIDLNACWITFPRVKTGIERRCPLWPETVSAINESLERRIKPLDPSHEGLLFITKYRKPWAEDGCKKWPLSAEFRKLLVKVGCYRPGLSFYSLRHQFQTIADEMGDYIATRRIMGHTDPSMGDVYRERFPDERLKRVTDHIRCWLFGAEGGAA